MDLVTKIEEKLTDEQKKELEPTLNEIKTNNQKLVKEIDEFDKKLKNAISSRDKTKDTIKQIKLKIGLNENDEFNFDVLDEKMNKDVDLKELEEKYGNQIKSLANEKNRISKDFERQIKAKDEELKSKMLDFEVMKVQDKFNPADGASDDILRALKIGAKFEDNTIKYYNQDGTILRNSNGVEATVMDKLTELKNEKSFYFKADAQPTGGQNQNNTPNSGVNGLPQGANSFETMMQERLKQTKFGR